MTALDKARKLLDTRDRITKLELCSLGEKLAETVLAEGQRTAVKSYCDKCYLTNCKCGPVAWMWEYLGDKHASFDNVVDFMVDIPVTPLYTRPLKSLSDEDVHLLARSHGNTLHFNALTFARAVEARLKGG